MGVAAAQIGLDHELRDLRGVGRWEPGRRERALHEG
jgi:hypothetical protein